MSERSLGTSFTKGVGQVWRRNGQEYYLLSIPTQLVRPIPWWPKHREKKKQKEKQLVLAIWLQGRIAQSVAGIYTELISKENAMKI